MAKSSVASKMGKKKPLGVPFDSLLMVHYVQLTDIKNI